MSQLCKNCKFWGQGDWRPFEDGFKRCLQLEEALDQDGEPFGGPAALATPALFGCSLFKSAAQE